MSVFRVRSGNPGIWTPHALGRDVLAAWWSASTLAAGAVVTWTDMISGIAPTQATGANQPVCSLTSFNSAYPGVTFDGTNDFLQVSPVSALLPTGTASGAIIALASQTKLAAVTGVTRIVAYGTGSANASRQIGRDVAASVNRARADTPSLTDTIVDFSGSHIMAAQWDATTEYGFIDGAAFNPASIASSYNTGTTTVTIGAQLSAANFWTGVISDILVLRGLISTANWRRLEGFLVWQTGLASLLPSDHPYKNARPTS